MFACYKFSAKQILDCQMPLKNIHVLKMVTIPNIEY